MSKTQALHYVKQWQVFFLYPPMKTRMTRAHKRLIFAVSLAGLATCLAIAITSPKTLANETQRSEHDPPAEALAIDSTKTHLQTYCVDCHGPDKQKANIRLDSIDHDIVHGKDAELWQLVLDQVNLGEMPPKKSKQPEAVERRALVDHLTQSLKEAAEVKRQEVRGVMRRLTKSQYSHALQDLLHLDVDFGKELPSEMLSDDGFTNNGEDQVTSLLQTEYYLAIAEKALAKAIVTDRPTKVYRYDLTFGKDINKDTQEKKAPRKAGNHEVPVHVKHHLAVTSERSADAKGFVKTDNHRRCYPDLRGDKKSKRATITEEGIVLPPGIPNVEFGPLLWLAPRPSLKLHLGDFPYEGDFVLRVTAAKADDSEDDPYLRAMVGEWLDHGEDYMAVEQAIRVTGTPESPQVIEFRGRLENFPIPVFDPVNQDIATMLVFGLWNDCLAREESERTPAVLIKRIELECGPRDWPPRSQQQILIPSEHADDEMVYSREVIAHFMRRAFRRDLDTTEIDTYHALWKTLRPDCATFEQSIRETLAGVLVSPHFLYFIEDEPVISEYQLASRLAAFLWDSIPDDRLLTLAKNQQLREQLPAEFDRMVNDPKSQRFVKSFCNEWLQIEKMTHTPIDRKQFPRYNRFVRDDMIRETQHFFAEILREDLSIMTFIDSPFTMLNQNLAQFYGIDRVRGADFRRVALDDASTRGGLLSQGLFLSGNSNGKEPHPVKRGAWLLSRVLDDPPPPPPPNVPQLDEDDPEFAKLSVMQQLAKHRDNPSCYDCHNKLDPWGLVLEDYNAVGLWHVNNDTHSKVTLPDGTAINGVAELKDHLLDHKQEQFTRGLVRNLARYSLGRSLSFTDNQAIDAIVERVEQSEHRFQTLLLALIESPLFSKK